METGESGKWNLVDYQSCPDWISLPVGFDISSRVPNVFHSLRIPECIVAQRIEGSGFPLCWWVENVFGRFGSNLDVSLKKGDHGKVAKSSEVGGSVLLHPEIPVHLGFLGASGLKIGG